MSFTTTLALLVFGHMLADYPLQGDFLSRAKNRRNPIPGAPWWQAMLAHSIIHAGFVFIITGNLILGLLELVTHAITDHRKCCGFLTFNQDQALHLYYKVLWAIIAVGITSHHIPSVGQI